MNEILPGTALRLGFKRFPPLPELAALVECLWAIGGTDTPALQCSEKLYPDGGCSLSITLSEHGASAAIACNKHTAQQQFSTYRLTISARFLPGALYSLFQLSPIDLPAGYCDATLLLRGKQKYSLQQLLLQLPQCGLLAAITAFEQWLLQHSLNVTRPKRLQHALQLLTVPDYSISSAAGELGVSRRTLERQMTLHTGFNPAYFQQCMQIKLARYLLCQSTPELANVALAAGFYDQSHFCHAFRNFTGETPAHYRQRKLSQFYNTQRQRQRSLG
jgi:AraC-like DNA-binding protein